MKKFKICLLAAIFFIGGCFIWHEISSAQATTMLNPHMLTTGSEKDLAAAAKYQFDTDGTFLYPMKLTQSGCLEMAVYAKEQGYITVEVHRKADGSDLPSYIGLVCTADHNNQYTAYQYLQKGTYYLKFPKNSYDLRMTLYSSAQRTLKNGSTLASYCDSVISDTFVYKATDTGYITISQKRLIETAAPMSVSFHNSKGKKITDIVSDHEIATKIVFPVVKGKSYKISSKTLSVDGQQYYQLHLDFATFTEKSGAKKAKAVPVDLEKTKKGMIYAEDSTKKEDWYKFKNPKNQKLKLEYFGDVTSGSINLTLYNSKGKKMGIYYLMPTKGDSTTYKLHTPKKETVIPKGTYYIKVNKIREQTAGVYKFKIFP